MEKSALQIARAAYQPKLPKALQGPVKAVEGAATQSVGNQEEIKALFPNTYGMPVITFEAGEAQEIPAFNVGVILSGGQAPGGHNVISGLFDGVKSLNPANKLYGFILGPGGLVDHKYMEITSELMDEYRNTGGFDIIGSGRTKLEKEDQFEKGIEILRELGIKALVIIGGDDPKGPGGQSAGFQTPQEPCGDARSFHVLSPLGQPMRQGRPICRHREAF